MRRSGVLATVLLALVALVGAASAAPARLGLSWDGRTWQPSLSGALFDGPGSIGSWVPGDVDTRTFYVRNQSEDPATLTLQYVLPADALVDPGDLSLSLRVGGGPWADLVPGAGTSTVESVTMDAGSSTAVSVRGSFAWTSDRSSQDLVVPVGFQVHLAGIAAGTAGGPGGNGGGNDGDGGDGGVGTGDGGPDSPSAGTAAPGDGLASTGAPSVGWPLGLGAACLTGGVLIVVLTRRRRETRC
jgi:hypothetical protein